LGIIGAIGLFLLLSEDGFRAQSAWAACRPPITAPSTVAIWTGFSFVSTAKNKFSTLSSLIFGAVSLLPTVLRYNLCFVLVFKTTLGHIISVKSSDTNFMNSSNTSITISVVSVSLIVLISAIPSSATAAGMLSNLEIPIARTIAAPSLGAR